MTRYDRFNRCNSSWELWQCKSPTEIQGDIICAQKRQEQLLKKQGTPRHGWCRLASFYEPETKWWLPRLSPGLLRWLKKVVAEKNVRKDGCEQLQCACHASMFRSGSCVWVVMLMGWVSWGYLGNNMRCTVPVSWIKSMSTYISQKESHQ